MPRLHLSCASAAAQIGCAGAKAWFCLRENFVHENLGRLLPAIFRDLKDNPTSAYATQRSASGFLFLRGIQGHASYKTPRKFTLSACSSPL